jgi:hypothetical protein
LNRQNATIAKGVFCGILLGVLGVLAVQWFFAVMPMLID